MKTSMNDIVRFVKLNKRLTYRIIKLIITLVFAKVFTDLVIVNANDSKVAYILLLFYIITISALFFVVKEVMNCLFEFEEQKDIPIPRKRYTKLSSPNIISVDEEDYKEMICYLYELENFIEDNNLNRDNKKKLSGE